MLEGLIIDKENNDFQRILKEAEKIKVQDTFEKRVENFLNSLLNNVKTKDKNKIKHFMIVNKLEIKRK